MKEDEFFSNTESHMKNTAQKEKREHLDWAWNDFVRENSQALSRIEESASKERVEDEKRIEQDMASALIEHFFDSLSSSTWPGEIHDQPLSKDLHALKKAIAGILEVKKENIIDEKEAKALFEFILERFIVRRFDMSIKLLLPSGRSKHWFFRSSRLIK
jgi:hypothetical protein